MDTPIVLPHRRRTLPFQVGGRDSVLDSVLESTLATSELTSSSTLVGDVEDHDEPINDLSINIGDLRINLIVDLLLGLSVGLLPSELTCYPTGQAIC
jgi:hypothetical protein